MVEGDTEQVIERELIAREEHQWVRLTHACNNRCRFCLDADSLDGTHRDKAAIEAEIRDGRNRGATRLILSGGEPTIHPCFVDFVHIGRQAGYRKIQTITNGRMFSYRAFLERALAAGLSEITFSVHGPNAAIHDALVGVPGAFVQQQQALRLALADGRAVVNVDVCLNGENIRVLPQILDECMTLGVREFDLLHLIPFGRAFAEGSSSLDYDIDSAMPSIDYALALARRPDLHVWFNRFPPQYLEGHEHLIQDPTKLLDEVRGRAAELARWMKTGQALACRAPSRCGRCALAGFCDLLAATRERLERNEFDVLRVDLRRHTSLPSLRGGEFTTCWIRADGVATAARAAATLPGADLILELERFDGLATALTDGSVAGKRLRRVYVPRPDELAAITTLGGFEVVAVLNDRMARALTESSDLRARVALAAPSFATAAAANANVGVLAFLRREVTAGPVEGLPACLTGRPPPDSPAVLDADLVDPDGHLDAAAFARRFIIAHYTVKSRRCRACALDAACKGAPINLVRVAGFRILRPVSP